MEMSNSIFSLSPEEFKETVSGLNEPAYRANQLLGWLYQRLALSFAEMTDLPEDMRRKLAERYLVGTIEPAVENVSADGLVNKVLFKLSDGETVESVLMLYPDEANNIPRRTVCVSSQVGCPVGCPFCATGQQGFTRNLTPGEIVEQVLYFERVLRAGNPGERNITNVVFMGMGEPLANHRALVRSINLLQHPKAFGLGSRQITVSTSGLVPRMRDLVTGNIKVELAVSLHAPNDVIRDRLVPLNRKYPLQAVLKACWQHYEKTGRRPTFEYILFHGINDSPQQACELSARLAGHNCLVNLIPANETSNREYQPPSHRTVMTFQNELRQAGIICTIRQSKGSDIRAGCGQLRSQYLLQQ